MTARTAALATLGFVTLFWVGDFVGGQLQSGYSYSRDFISALAGFGANHAWVGMAAIACSGLAHITAAVCLRHVLPGGGATNWAAGLLAASGVATLVVASFRITCVGGAAKCHLPGSDPSRGFTDDVHGRAVMVFEVLFVLALVLSAIVAFRAGRPVFGTISAIVAVASPAIGLSVGDVTPGSRERLWVAVGQAWLLTVAALAAADK